MNSATGPDVEVATETSTIKLHAEDNVILASRSLSEKTELNSVSLQNDIPAGHKIALEAIGKGDPVRKYGQIIGYASQPIAAGEHVHTHNLEFRSLIHNYEFGTQANGPILVNAPQETRFMGYRRDNGKVGTRNYIAVLTSVNCSATAARHIAAEISTDELANYENVDGVVAFVHATGCGMADSGDGFANLQRVLWGYARNPNIAGVLLVGLGCEINQIDFLLDAYDIKTGPLFRTMNIQTIGGMRKTIGVGAEFIREMLPIVNSMQREPCPASELVLGLQCGGSDAWSGMTANPALGYASDLLVAAGGTAVLSETPEIYGAEHLLTRRAVDCGIGQKLLDRVKWWEDYADRNFGSIDNNPSHGNKQGGLTTILEKSLGAVAKAGTSQLRGVFRYGEIINQKGLVFMDSPGFDPCSVTGQVASGCNLIAFTTGRGSAFGCKPSPSIKIATNDDLFQFMTDDMDINAGLIRSGQATVEQIGHLIYSELLAVASGQQTKSESQGLGDFEFVPWQIGATM